MSTIQSDLFKLLRDLPIFESSARRKAAILMTDYPYMGFYLNYGGSINDFVQTLITEVTARGQHFTIAFFTSLVREVDLGIDVKEKVAALTTQLAALDLTAWQRAFPTERMAEADRAALTADPDMLSATVVSTILRPYFELGAEKLDPKAVDIANQIATRVEQAFATPRHLAIVYRAFRQAPAINEADFLTIFRDTVSDDPALAQSMALLLTNEPEKTEAALQSIVKVAETITTVKGQVVGAIVGADALEGIGIHVDVTHHIDTVESGGSAIGAVIGNPGRDLQIGNRDYHGPVIDKQINTGGGAYVGGNVDAGRDFIGRDSMRGIEGQNVHVDQMVIYQGDTRAPQQPNSVAPLASPTPHLTPETIRLDVAAPTTAVLEEPFDLAVAVRQPDAPTLELAELINTVSDQGRVFRQQEGEIASYKVKVSALGCTVVPDHYILGLYLGENSPVRYFQITPQRPGRRTILVEAQQVKDGMSVAQTRIDIRVEVPVTF